MLDGGAEVDADGPKAELVALPASVAMLLDMYDAQMGSGATVGVEKPDVFLVVDTQRESSRRRYGRNELVGV